MYDTLLNDTSSTEPFCRKKLFVEVSFCRTSTSSKHVSSTSSKHVSSNTFDEIFYAHLVAILYLLILQEYLEAHKVIYLVSIAHKIIKIQYFL